MIITDDPIADFHSYDDERERRLAKKPICEECEQHIQLQEDAVCIDGKWYCDDCLSNLRKDIGEHDGC